MAITLTATLGPATGRTHLGSSRPVGIAAAESRTLSRSTTNYCDSPTIVSVATYFAQYHHGRTMANGERFDMFDPTTTASNRWPIGTRLQVRRVPGGPWDRTLSGWEHDHYFNRSVTVTVKDRGAFTHALDLSWGAFSLLGRGDEGVIRVEIAPAGCFGDDEPPA